MHVHFLRRSERLSEQLQNPIANPWKINTPNTHIFSLLNAKLANSKKVT